jgi:hypothetical protein
MAASSSSANSFAAVSFLSAYHRAARSASSSASSRNSSVRVTAGGYENPAAGFRPWDCLRLPSIETLKTSSNLYGPGCFGVLVHLRIQALEQFPSERCSLFWRQLKCFG